MEEEREVIRWAAEQLRRRGIEDQGFLLVLCAMLLDGVDYEGAVDALADFWQDAPERINATLCYRVIVSPGEIVHPRKIMSDILDDWRKLNDYRISAAKGS